MRIIDHAGQEREQWRPGVLTRMRVSARTGAAQLCIFEQWCDPGYGAPTHLHAIEEVLTVLAGSAEVWVGEERATVTAGQSVIVPAGHRHGFRNNGEAVLHV
jgi:mannose-6-phosphate isomerase-like protein (cupin superfamily)